MSTLTPAASSMREPTTPTYVFMLPDEPPFSMQTTFAPSFAATAVAMMPPEPAPHTKISVSTVSAMSSVDTSSGLPYHSAAVAASLSLAAALDPLAAHPPKAPAANVDPATTKPPFKKVLRSIVLPFRIRSRTHSAYPDQA